MPEQNYEDSWFVFGKDKPKITYAQDPEKGVLVTCENANILHCRPNVQITWGMVVDQVANLGGEDWEKGSRETRRKWHRFREDIVRQHPQLLKRTILKLRELCDTDTETALFDRFINWELLAGTELQAQLNKHLKTRGFSSRKLFGILGSCEKQVDSGKCDYGRILGLPALIPQYWVNWLPESAKNGERARRARLMPFRVDSLLQCSKRFLTPPLRWTPEAFPVRKIIIEIDGPPHFRAAGASIGRNSPVAAEEAEASLREFTKHLRKDRWLRNAGWEVYRFSVSEVEKESIHFFLRWLEGDTDPRGTHCLPSGERFVALSAPADSPWEEAILLRRGKVTKEIKKLR